MAGRLTASVSRSQQTCTVPCHCKAPCPPTRMLSVAERATGSRGAGDGNRSRALSLGIAVPSGPALGHIPLTEDGQGHESVALVGNNGIRVGR
jgi:hypothetical protein